MLASRIEDITGAHLEVLVSNKTAESFSLEFKRDLPSADNAGRHEFCADISAFANAAGGDIVYGMEEDSEGRANGVVPRFVNSNQEVLRLLDLAANGIEPKLSGLAVHPVEVNAGYVFVVRVPRSWNAPHRVRTNQHFFIREGRRKRQLEMAEIRNAFIRSESQRSRIEQFRRERVQLISERRPPVGMLAEGPLCALHIIPLSLTEGAVLDPRPFYSDRRLPTIGGGGGYSRINVDGALRQEVVDGRMARYTQLFRSGEVEAIRVFTSKTSNEPFIPSTAMERELIGFFGPMLNELSHFEVGLPIAVLLSLIGVANVRFAVRGEREWGDEPSRFDRTPVLLPHVLIEQHGTSEMMLRPVFDLLWQSVGFPGSQNYDATGNWVG